MKLLKMKDLQALLGLGKTSVYSLVKSGAIPRPIHLSKRRVVWVESEVLDFIEKMKEARG